MYGRTTRICATAIVWLLCSCSDFSEPTSPDHSGGGAGGAAAGGGGQGGGQGGGHSTGGAAIGGSEDPGPEIVPVPGPHTSVDLGDLTIAPERVPNWSMVGVEGGIPDTSSWPTINAVDHGATPDDDSDDDAAAINSAIAAAAASHPQAVVYLPAGEYTIVQPNLIDIVSNVVLRGDGPDQTIIHSVLGGSASAGVRFRGSDSGDETALVGGLEQGSDVLSLEQTPTFSVDDYVLVYQDNDERISPATYHAHGIGQVVKVKAIDGVEVTIEPHLRVHLNPAFQPRVSRPAFVSHSGLEDLAIDFGSVPNVPLYQGATIQFRHAHNSWVRNVRAENTYHVFLDMQYSARLTIADSHFKTMQKPDYTNAYAINFSNMASDSLATNNIVEDVWVTATFTHSASGNVYAYNYHVDIRDDHGVFHHGAYPFENLIEGNQVDRITNDCWWGKQGPRLTFFRNRANEIRTSRNGDCQNQGNIVAEQANFLSNTADYYLSFPWCTYPDGCHEFDDYNVDMWAEKNRYRQDFKGIGAPNATSTFVDNVHGAAPATAWATEQIPDSLYLNRKPDFWCDEIPWPAIGADVDDDAALAQLPAERRYRDLSCSH